MFFDFLRLLTGTAFCPMKLEQQGDFSFASSSSFFFAPSKDPQYSNFSKCSLMHVSTDMEFLPTYPTSFMHSFYRHRSSSVTGAGAGSILAAGMPLDLTAAPGRWTGGHRWTSVDIGGTGGDAI